MSETVACKKCGEQHRIEEYRTLKYYYCPKVNRVLLLSDAVNTRVAEQDPPWQLVLGVE